MPSPPSLPVILLLIGFEGGGGGRCYGCFPPHALPCILQGVALDSIDGSIVHMACSALVLASCFTGRVPGRPRREACDVGKWPSFKPASVEARSPPASLPSPPSAHRKHALRGDLTPARDLPPRTFPLTVRAPDERRGAETKPELRPGRTWQQADSGRPPGMAGRRRVSRLFFSPRGMESL